MNIFDKQYWNLEKCLEALKRLGKYKVAKITICISHGVSFDNDTNDLCDEYDIPLKCGLALNHAIITIDDYVQLANISCEIGAQELENMSVKMNQLKEILTEIRKEVENGK